ncbi:septation protein IspZ [Lichenicola sp.]|uniref:septation protein IspZ n=1 Tax=Lichenicola sp. TaxID=2804529 RepID=UPI003B00B665
MDRLKRLLGTAAFDFGGVIVFYALMKTLGLRAAIIGTLVFVPIDALRRHTLRIGFPRIYVLSTALVLVFGTIDVFSRQPFMLKYEGAVTETIVGIAFAIGSRGRSIIEELVAQQQPDLRMPHHRRFFQLITRSWAVYYLCMACAFLWVSQHFTLVQAVGIRQVAGLGGAIVMALFSFSGRFAFRLFQALRLLPADGAPDHDAAGDTPGDAAVPASPK